MSDGIPSADINPYRHAQHMSDGIPIAFLLVFPLPSTPYPLPSLPPTLGIWRDKEGLEAHLKSKGASKVGGRVWLSSPRQGALLGSGWGWRACPSGCC